MAFLDFLKFLAAAVFPPDCTIESRIAIREGPQKNGKRANLALYFYKAACLTQA